MAMFRRLITVAAVSVAALALAPSGSARTLEAGPGKAYAQPSAAIAAARKGDTVSIYPGEYFDCAIVQADDITIQGVGDAEKILLTDKPCGGKGLLVIVGNGVTVRNLTLTRARVPDGNGAGIRGEAPDLTVDHVRFINNQNAILATTVGGGTITIKDSLMERNGGCGNPGGCAHGIYIGSAALLHIEGTTFVGTKQGHHVKSRALRTEVLGCTFADGEDGTASYHVEISNGGSVVVRNSKFQKGVEAENHSAIIIIGNEIVTQPTREIVVENNTVRSDGSWPTIFVRNMTATDAMLRGNTFSGKIAPLEGDGKVVR